MRILHFSDPHFDLSLHAIPWKKWFGKRAIGALNLLGGRGKRFDEAEEKIEALARFSSRQGVDLMLCTGDYTALGLYSELENAAKLIEILSKSCDTYITIPGNHDVYSIDAIRGGHFPLFFGEYMGTDCPEFLSDDIWPFVRLFGHNVAVIGLNSAKPNPIPWRSDGHIPTVQLDSFRKIVQDERIRDRFIFVMTHYAARTERDEPDTRLHGLSNADEFLDICSTIRRGAILNGHIHRCYSVQPAGVNIYQYCAGSISMDGREGFWLFDIEDDNMEAKRGVYENGEFVLIECVTKTSETGKNDRTIKDVDA